MSWRDIDTGVFSQQHIFLIKLFTHSVLIFFEFLLLAISYNSVTINSQIVFNIRNANHLKNLRIMLFMTFMITPVVVIAKVQDDKFELLNRAMFNFNETVDLLFLKPLAQLYVRLMPAPVERAVGSMVENLNEMTTAANCGLQGKSRDMFRSSGRFLINTSIGLGGFFDMAHAIFKLQSVPPEDFGQTLAVWGITEGPYLVLPLVGPSNLRDVSGLMLGSLTNPLNFYSEVKARNSIRALSLVSIRGELLGIEDIITGDRYIFIRDVYHQKRKYSIMDGVVEDDFGFDDDY